MSITLNPYKVKDSGKRVDFNSGMRRDIETNKPRFDLLLSLDQPYSQSLLHRWAMLMTNGAEKYGERNWEKSNSVDEMNRFKSSAFRHFMQLMGGENDEDHFAAVCFNLNAILRLMGKMNCDVNGKEIKK